MTKHGKVTLDWQNKKGSWSMRGSVPQGVPYRVELPDGKVWEGIGCEEFELL
jgi:hypothetical protein